LLFVLREIEDGRGRARTCDYLILTSHDAAFSEICRILRVNAPILYRSALTSAAGSAQQKLNNISMEKEVNHGTSGW
jgi:hypothetical protein